MRKQVNLEKLSKLLSDIEEGISRIEQITNKYPDEELATNDILIDALKYSIIVIAEAMSNVLQHLLAKIFKNSVDSYADVIEKAMKRQILSKSLYVKLKPFFKFRNLLIHGYWKTDNELFLKHLREGVADFKEFTSEIEAFVRKSYFSPTRE